MVIFTAKNSKFYYIFTARLLKYNMIQTAILSITRPRCLLEFYLGILSPGVKKNLVREGHERGKALLLDPEFVLSSSIKLKSKGVKHVFLYAWNQYLDKD